MNLDLEAPRPEIRDLQKDVGGRKTGLGLGLALGRGSLSNHCSYTHNVI